MLNVCVSRPPNHSILRIRYRNPDHDPIEAMLFL
jgi:hypothetical protein